MGRDKALLLLGDGRLLWQRQVEILRALGPEHLFFSGPARAGLPEDIELLADSKPGLGPLAGLVEGLRVMKAPLLLVLAIDLPAMTSEYLLGLLKDCASGRGCVAKRGGWFEPLAAVYPHDALEIAEEALASKDRSLQTVVRQLVSRDRLAIREVDEPSDVLFANWNQGCLDDIPRHLA